MVTGVMPSGPAVFIPCAADCPCGTPACGKTSPLEPGLPVVSSPKRRLHFLHLFCPVALPLTLGLGGGAHRA